MSKAIEPRDAMRIEKLAVEVFEKSGIESMTAEESAKFLMQVILHAVRRLLSIRGRDWTQGLVDTLQAYVREVDLDREAARRH